MINWIRQHLNNSLFLNTYLLIVIRLLGAGLGFLFWVLAARTMTADNVGLASGIVSATMLLAGLAQLGLGYGLVKYLNHTDNPNGLLNISIVLSGLASLGLALLFLLGLHHLSPALLPLRANLLTSILFLTLVLSTALSQLLHWGFLATRQLTYSLIKQVSQSFLAIVLLLTLNLLIFPGYIAVVTAYTVATLISLLVSFFVFLPKIQPGYGFNLKFGVVPRFAFAKFSLTNFVTDQIQRGPETLLPLIVIQQFGPSTGAYFFIVWTIGRTMTSWSGSIAESLFAEGSNTPGLATAYARRAVKFGLLLAGGLTLAMLAGSRLILSIYGQDYAAYGVQLLYYVALASIPGVLISIFIGFFRIQNHLKAILAIITASAGGGILFSYIGIVFLGFTGAGIGWLAAQILVLGCTGVWWQWNKSRRRKQMVYAPQAIVDQVV